MKKIKSLFMFIFAVAFAFTSMIKAYAVDDVIKFVSQRQIDNTVFNSYENKALKFYNAGTTVKMANVNGKDVYAFCFNHAYDAPPAGTQLKYNKQLTEQASKYVNAYYYILENGYGGNWNTKYEAGLSSDTKKREDDKYYVTQLAIWGILYQYDTTNGVNIENENRDQNGNALSSRLQAIKNNAIALRNDALNNKYPEPTITLSDESKGTLTKADKYYRTGTMKADGFGYEKATIEVSGVAGAEIIDGKGESYGTKANFEKGRAFYVRIPESTVTTKGVTLNIKASAQGIVRKLAIYTPVGKYQNVGVPYVTTKPLETSLAAKGIISKGKIKITKVYKNAASAESLLDGVKLQLIDASGKVVKEWVTSTANGTNPMVITDLEPGTYTLHEDSAPSDEYTKAADKKITIVSGDNADVKMVNTKDVDVSISKQDATTGQELPGAKIVLTNAVGEVIDEWTSTDTPHIVKNKDRADGKLLPGKYCMEETIAPEGYQKTSEKVCFEVNDEGKVDHEVVMYNQPKTSVKISKQDLTTKKELPGATLTIKNEKGEVVDKWVSGTTPHYVTLPDGNYKLIELTAPEGYGISEEVIDFTIKNGEAEKTIVMTNEPIPVTADMNITVIIIGLVVTVLLVGFSLFKLNKQQEA